MAQETIRKVSSQELLNKFYNIHLNKLISSWINLEIFEKKDPKEKVGERVMPPMAKGQMPMRMDITAKEALAQEQKRFKGQSKILWAIKKRENELNKLKKEDEIWQKK